MTQSRPHIVIIGAGPCGLGAGWRLKDLGYDNYTIYERESYVGGLAASFTDMKGFTWDIGGHVIHSHYDYFDEMFEDVLQKKYLTHTRESWIYLLRRFVPYPFQNNIQRLPEVARNECLQGLRNVSGDSKATPKNFADWIYASFGAGVSKYFLYPYNYKVWAYPPEKMNYQWIGDRVARVDIAQIERNIASKTDDVSWGPNAVFQFPLMGGTGAIWQGVAATIASHIQCQKEIIRIDTAKKYIQFSDGSEDTYDVLLSTTPMDQLARLTGEVMPKGNSLHHSSVSIVGLGFVGLPPEHLRNKCWMYFPEDHAPFFRATVFSHYSPNNAPKDHWSLMTEVSSSAYREEPEHIGERVISGAKAVELIQKNQDPVDVWVHRSEYGYPTPTLGRDAIIDKMLPKFEKNKIYSRGRFGAWKYEVSNQDHTFMQGVEWVNHVLEGKDEVTVHHPEIVNDLKKTVRTNK